MTANHDDDELLRHYYEKELEHLRRDLRAFAQRHPEAAARLSINSDGRSDDLRVERLAQSAALLHARHSAKIDDDYPELTEALTRISYPQYLRPFPSCSIAQFDTGDMFDRLAEPVRIARSAQLLTMTGNCGFRTTYEVMLAPLQITRASYSLAPTAPARVTLPPDASGVISVTFRSTKKGASLDVATPAALRVHLTGQPAMVAALLDTMLLRTAAAYVEDGAGRWARLSRLPLDRAGFGPRDWLFTDPKEPGQAFGLLGEYFAFARRFHFIDIDFASLCMAAPGNQLTLHLVVAGVPPSSRIAQQLVQLSSNHLKLFCTPVVNLFAKKDVALKYDSQAGSWPISVQVKDDALTEVWSVDQVRTDQCIVLRSSGALMADHASDAQPRWKFTEGSRPASADTGRTAALCLVGANGAMLTGGGGVDSLLTDVTCFNGDLPRSLPIGASEGDMRLEGKAQAAKKIALLDAPTAVARLRRSDGALWTLIGQHSAHAIHLNQTGLPVLKQVLRQFAALSPAQARHIEGITSLRHRPVMTLVPRAPQPAMVRGIEITLEIDEQLFVANSVAVFAGVMERYFAPHAATNSFVQLLIQSNNGFSLWRGEPVRGAGPLI